MIDWILNIQKKPENQRKKFAIFFSIFVTLIVAVLWFVALVSDTKDLNNNATPKTEIAGPLDSLRSSFSSFIDSTETLFKAL